MRRFISAILLLCVLSMAALAGDSPAGATAIPSDDHGDPVLKAMIAELKRSQEKLQLGQLQRPYYIDYQVTELRTSRPLFTWSVRSAPKIASAVVSRSSVTW